MGIRFMAVDSGFNTSKVYDFGRKHPGKVAAIKGLDGQATIVSAPRQIDVRGDGRKSPYSIRLYTVGVGVVKDEVYGCLRLKPEDDGSTPDGYCHFPDYDEKHFKGLTAESKVTVLVRGYPRDIWQKAPGSRNEPLDCRVYARAAAAIVGIDRMQPADWDALAGEVDPEKRAQSRTEQPKRRKSSFWGS
jgi:phage terminase large subunit GpA-like protein